MEFWNNLSHFVQGYIWATILFPVEYYFAKPVIIKVWSDIQTGVNKVIGNG